MERKKCADLNNSEIREYVMSLENEYEAKKAKIKLMCEELIEIENAYNEAQNEIKIRKTVF
jgi:hypothetical protein